MKFLKEGFDVFVLASFEDKSGCRILDLLEFVKNIVWENLIEENYSSQVLTKQRHRGGFWMLLILQISM